MRFSLLCTSFVLLLLLQCVSNSVAVTVFHRCIHDTMTERVGSVLSEGDRSTAPVSKASSVPSAAEKLELPEREDPHRDWQPIRIKVFVKDLEKEGRYCATDEQKILNDFGENVDCTSEDVLTPEKKDILLNTILKEAVQLHSERLYVKPLKGALVVPNFSNESICAKFTVPEEHYTDGVADVDMVLYVSAAPMKFQRTFAWSVSCATLGTQEQPGRPVVGVMNYAPKYIVATAQQVRVAAHEIAHALGFSVNEMMKLQMLKDVNDVRKKGKVSVVSSANTLRETWWQYNCNNTEGMELEDQAPPKSKKSQGGDKGQGKTLRARTTEKVDGPRKRPVEKKTSGEHQVEGRKQSGPKDKRANNTSSTEKSKKRSSDLSSSSGGGQNGKLPKPEKKTPGSTAKKETPPKEHPEDKAQPASSLTATVANVQDAPQNEKEKVIAVEKQRELRTPLNTFSHWKRRNAKDELMAGIVGAGYYTALTMAAFADLGYYMVDWSKEERMSWGNHSGCKLLDEKCVNEGKTEYTDMFCTTNDTRLQCTSDRHALGKCSLQEVKPLPPMPSTEPPPTDLPLHFQYFADKNIGTAISELMDHCPFITPNNDTWCTDGDEERMPGSIIAPNSRCVKGEELKVKEKNIGDVCVKVSCRNGTVSVKYKGNDEWHACTEGTKLNVDTTELKGHIVCPKYYDVCNTINRTLDELEGPQPPKPETQPETPEANNPTPAAENLTDSASQGTTVSTATTTTTSTPSTQGTATPNGDANDATATGDVAAGALDSNNSVSIEIRHTDVVAAPAAAALFVPFVCLLLVTTMVAVS